MMNYGEKEEGGESEASDVIMRSGSHDSEHVDNDSLPSRSYTNTQAHFYKSPSHSADNHTHPNP